jgi:hypothetical protein
MGPCGLVPHQEHCAWLFGLGSCQRPSLVAQVPCQSPHRGCCLCVKFRQSVVKDLWEMCRHTEKLVQVLNNRYVSLIDLYGAQRSTNCTRRAHFNGFLCGRGRCQFTLETTFVLILSTYSSASVEGLATERTIREGELKNREGQVPRSEAVSREGWWCMNTVVVFVCRLGRAATSGSQNYSFSTLLVLA